MSNEFNLPKYKVNDEDDQKYLDLALSVNADYLITGNVKDFPLKNYHFLEVIPSDEFLRLFSINISRLAAAHKTFQFE